MILFIFFLLLAICVSFFCSIAEAVILSVRPTYISTLMDQQPKTAKRLQALQGNLDRPLAAILTANTIAHTVGAAGVGAQAAVVFGNQYLGITSAVLTFLILVFSEIIPKTLGANYWRTLAPVIGMLIHWLTVILTPFVWLSEHLTRLISRSDNKGATFSKAEMKAMAEIGAKEGVLEAKELKILRNMMQLDKLSIRDIMTPRTVIFSIPEDMTVKKFFDQHANKPFSRIPTYKGNSDNITGYVLKIDLLMAQAEDKFDLPMTEFQREFSFVLDTLSASKLFDTLMYDKSHIALVVDEYGTTQGLVTQEDVVETIIGLEITDELDRVEDMQVLAHERWKERMQSIGIDPDSLKISARK